MSSHYSWKDYYKSAYEAEKRRNALLVGKVADAEAEHEELKRKYEAICVNPLYRASRMLSVPKRGCKKIVREVRALLESGRNGTTSEEFPSSDREQSATPENAYRHWIGEVEPILWRRCREALREKMDQAAPGKTCLVISYRSLAGVTDLAGVIKQEVFRHREEQEMSLAAADQRTAPDILLFAENPEDLDRAAVTYIENWFAVYPETKLFYGGEDHRTGEERSFPWFKPCFSPDTLFGFFYFGSFFAVDRAWAERTAFAGYEDAGQNLYDFVLRLLKPFYEKAKSPIYEKDDGFRRETEETEAAPARGDSLEIVCSDLVLYHRSDGERAEMAADRRDCLNVGETSKEANPEFWGFGKKYVKIKQDFINSMCYETDTLQTSYPEVWSVLPKPEKTGKEGIKLLSVIIPSKDHPELLQKCIGSFVERTALQEGWETVEFIVVDNGSDEKNRLVIDEFLKSNKAESHYLYQPMPFNFSAMCNLGAKKARGKYLLLLNDDMEVIEENWLRILLGQARMPGIGAVGAKLWYPEGEKIQHAGVTNMRVGPSHKLATFPDDRTYYYGRNMLPYDTIAVTGACLLVRKALYEEVGGFDEEMAVAYNDVDLCFKLLETGYRNVVRNDAVLLHHESASRGLDTENEEKWQRLLAEREALYKKHPIFYRYDPYYSEQLADNALEYRVGYQSPYERPLLTEAPERKEKKNTLWRSLASVVMLTAEWVKNSVRSVWKNRSVRGGQRIKAESAGVKSWKK